MAWKVVRTGEVPPHTESPGVTRRQLIGRDAGSVHFEIALVTLDPGARVGGVVHPFEESFYVLAGAGTVTIGMDAYQLAQNVFGMIPIGVPHAWAQTGDAPLELLRVRAPQPRPGVGPDFGDRRVAPRAGGTPPPREVAAPHRPVGTFESSHLPAPGPLAMKGYRGPRISGVSIWMLVDELVGAAHHTMFIVQFEPGGGRQTAGDHYHPFEEIYYFLSGTATAHLDGEDVPVAAGDIVFAGVNALHGYTITSDVPVRWIEVQAPVPPPHGGTFFPADWEADADGTRPVS